MAQAVDEWYKKMSIITKSYQTAIVVTTVGCSNKAWREMCKEIVKSPEFCGKLTFHVSLKQKDAGEELQKQVISAKQGRVSDEKQLPPIPG